MIKNLVFRTNLNTIRQTFYNRFSHTSFNSNNKDDNKENIKNNIDKMIKDKNVVVFMKGTANAPRCGFSKGVVQILNLHDVKFDSYNVLDSEELRSGIKEYSNWPTIPQVFFKGNII